MTVSSTRSYHRAQIDVANNLAMLIIQRQHSDGPGFGKLTDRVLSHAHAVSEERGGAEEKTYAREGGWSRQEKWAQ